MQRRRVAFGEAVVRTIVQEISEHIKSTTCNMDRKKNNRTAPTTRDAKARQAGADLQAGTPGCRVPAVSQAHSASELHHVVLLEDVLAKSVVLSSKKATDYLN